MLYVVAFDEALGPLPLLNIVHRFDHSSLPSRVVLDKLKLPPYSTDP